MPCLKSMSALLIAAAGLAAGLAAPMAQAQAQSLSDPLQGRLAELVSRINTPQASQADLMGIFAPVFRDQVSVSALESLLADLRSRLGPCRPLAQAPGSTRASASLLLRCERGIQAIDLSIETEAPHRINGFFVRQRYAELGS